MNIIIPMAGMGKRMRPHTLTTPKPLLPIAGKPIVHRLVEEIVATCDDTIENIGFVIGRNFGQEVENRLLSIATEMGSKGHIFYQDAAEGTAHAVYCAEPIMNGNVIVAFADTLFKGSFKLNSSVDGTIWVQKVEDPRAFGVVKLDEKEIITEFVEKPENFVSDLAIIGIYHFKDGENLANEIKYLLDNNIREKGEYQLTNALENMKSKGKQFTAGKVEEWLDCGNKNATVYTNQRILEHLKKAVLNRPNVTLENCEITEPCFIGEGVVMKNAKIGPHVSIGNNCHIEDASIQNSIIQEDCHITNANFHNSMIGRCVKYNGQSQQLSLSDYSTQID